MKKLLYNSLWVGMLLTVISCKKNTTETRSYASFTIVNAINNSDPLKADFTDKSDVFATTQVQTDYSTFNRFIIPAGQIVPVKIVSGANKNEVVYHNSFVPQPGDVYSLFLMGEIGSVDTLLIKESISLRTDSTMGIRFINCSPSGSVRIVVLKVDYSGVRTPQAEINELNYKEKTEFISYPAPSITLSSYRIELYDPVTNSLLSTVSVAWNMRNTTIIIRGFNGGSPALGAFRLGHDGPYS